MIVDVHSHLMWYPDHLSERYAQEALASKLVKLKNSGGEAYSAALDLHSYDSHPETHWAASADADRVIVFGLQARAVGVWVPNELIADYARQHPEKIEGWASVDPNEPDCVQQLEYCVSELGLRGLKLGPVYQHFDPQDRRHWPLFVKCQQLNLPIMWHQGTTFPSRARLAIWEACASDDWARARRLIADHARPLATLRESRTGNSVPVVKEAMNFLGLHGGRVRAPLLGLRSQDLDALESILSRMDAFRSA